MQQLFSPFLVRNENKDICQILHGRKIWVCPGGVPPPVQLYTQRSVWEGYQVVRDAQRPAWEGALTPKPYIHPPLPYGGKFWVAQPRHPGFFGLRNV